MKTEKEKELSTEVDTNKNEINIESVEAAKPETFSTNEILDEKPDPNFEAGGDVGEDFIEETEPKLMTETEKEEFVKEMQARVNEAIKDFWTGW